MTDLNYGQVTDDVLAAMEPPGRRYYFAMMALGVGILAAAAYWTAQVKVGMGLAGINHPVGWGVYIANFVFWVGIAHSGTLISAILHLVRSRWRSSVSRAAEAMTVFAVMTAGLFPLIHLGRIWVIYYIIPYPSQRQLWPNFTSPLVWDVVAVTTYLTVSVIFFFVGMLPDLAAARDRAERLYGPDHPRARFYRAVSLGWFGGLSQWRHYGRGYLFFAALATPLVISVHSVVSWDFAMSLLPGWHTTIFAPYFVAGAIHSGLGMVLILLIPLRRILKLERVITVDHFESLGKTLLVTTAVIGYAYFLEPLMAWYSGDVFEQQFAWWRATSAACPIYWALWPLNVLFPLLLVFKKVRRNLTWLLAIGVMINLGMWLERVQIVTFSTAHDFLSHNWGSYWPQPVEWTITLGAFCFFLFLFLAFAKILPTVAIADIKEIIGEKDRCHASALLPFAEACGGARAGHFAPARATRRVTGGVLAVYKSAAAMVEAVAGARKQGFDRLEPFAPYRVEEVERVLDVPKSPVRFWTLTGALSGMIGGFSLALGSGAVNGLFVGGKATAAVIVPYCVIAFEGTILLGTIGNLLGVLFYCCLGHRKRLPAGYDQRFSADRFGLWILCDPTRRPAATGFLKSTNPEEVREIS